jgi:hypothetical protein
VAVQVVVSSLLLVAAGLQSRTLIESSSVGDIQPEHVLLFSAVPDERGGAGDFVEPSVDGLARLPGIVAVSAAYSAFEDVPLCEDATGRRRQALVAPVSPGYFATVRIPLRGGRDLAWADGQGAGGVVINEAMAAMVFGRVNPVGQRLLLRTCDFGPEMEEPPTVVGVVADSMNRFHPDMVSGLGVAPTLYMLSSRSGLSAASPIDFAVRTAGHAALRAPEVREAMRTLAPGVRVERMYTQEQYYDRSGGRTVTLTFALLGLLAAAQTARPHRGDRTARRARRRTARRRPPGLRADAPPGRRWPGARPDADPGRGEDDGGSAGDP